MAKKIKIYGNATKGCIFFDGSTVDPKFLGTVFCDLNASNPSRLVIKRNDRRKANGEYRVLFRQLNPTRVQNEAGENLVDDLGFSVTDVCDYINEQATAVAAPSTGNVFSGATALDFIRDETNTSILFSNGDHHGINSLKAVAKENGKVGIMPIRGDVELYELEFTSCTINGGTAANTIETTVNDLNALFTLSAVTAPVPAPIYTQLDGVDTSWESSETINPTGDGFHGSGSSGTYYHGPRVWTTDTINEPGEYFTFEAKNVVAGGGPLLGIGLYSVANGDLAEIEDDNLSNSGHHGFFFSNWLYNYSGYTAPWTTYGSSPGLSYGPGWSFYGNTPMFRYSDANTIFRAGEGDVDGNALFKCGITDTGFVGVWYFDIEHQDVEGLYGARSDGWVLLCRSSTPVPAGEYGLMVKIPSTSGQITSLPRRFATDPAAPTLYYRYIESPDGVFQYPLFSSEEEANYIDDQNGGLGTSSQIVFPDESTQTAWYKPDTGYTDDGASAPADTATEIYTEIVSMTDSQLVPSPYFNPIPSVFDEGTSINIQLAPQDVSYTTTINGQPEGTSLSATGILQGTLPYVSEDTDYSIVVTRTNSFGSSQGTFTLTVEDNPALSNIAGWTHFQGNTVAPDQVLKSENAVLSYDTTISPGEEISWSHENYSTLGFLSAAGEAIKLTNDIARDSSAWEVQFTPWSNGALNHLNGYGVGFDNNSSQTASGGTWVGGTWKMVYQTDGYVKVYFDGVEILCSVATYSGPKTLVYATAESYSVDATIPSMTITTTAFIGDPPTGFTQTSGSMQDATTLDELSVVTLDLDLPVGKRLIIPASWVENNVLDLMDSDDDKVFFGVPKTSAAWGQIALEDFDMVIRLQQTSGGSAFKSLLYDNGSNQNQVTVFGMDAAYYEYALEWDGTDLHLMACDPLGNVITELGVADGGYYSRVVTHSSFTEQSGTLPLAIATNADANVTLSTAGLQVIDIPAPPASIVTPWTKALDFSGSSERTEMVSISHYYSPMLMDYQSVITSAPSTAGNTSSDTAARPWATAVVFSPDGNNSNQHIWNIGEGAGSTDDNIYLRIDSSRNLYFGWGRDGALNEYYLARVTAGSYNGVYVGFNGTRLSGNDATTTNLDAAFDIKLMFNTGNSTWGFNPNPTAQGWGTWSSTGGRMDRSVTGSTNIGGRGTNRSFHGKVASFVTTTLQRGVAMPGNTEIAEMITDPVGWLNDYKVGNTYRPSHVGDNNSGFSINNLTSASATQVYLMGDGSNDSYTNMIRNQVMKADQNYTKLNMLSMVSSDIQTVNISGLTS